MEKKQTDSDTKRTKHLRVPVFPREKEAIESYAAKAGKSVAAYLRDVGQGYEIKSVVDYQQVREMARINGDLGRLGGLLKLWLANDSRAALFGSDTIWALLSRIDARQEELGRVMRTVVRPKAKR